jgi:hypothetical protein
VIEGMKKRLTMGQREPSINVQLRQNGKGLNGNSTLEEAGLGNHSLLQAHVYGMRGGMHGVGRDRRTPAKIRTRLTFDEGEERSGEEPELEKSKLSDLAPMEHTFNGNTPLGQVVLGRLSEKERRDAHRAEKQVMMEEDEKADAEIARIEAEEKETYEEGIVGLEDSEVTGAIEVYHRIVLLNNSIKEIVARLKEERKELDESVQDKRPTDDKKAMIEWDRVYELRRDTKHDVIELTSQMRWLTDRKDREEVRLVAEKEIRAQQYIQLEMEHFPELYKSETGVGGGKAPKVNSKIGTLKQLTLKECLKGRGVWQWLDVFLTEVQPYAPTDVEKMAYLKSSMYVEASVWGDHLMFLGPDDHTFVELVKLLNRLYPDNSSIDTRLGEFLKLKQSEANVDMYSMKKQRSWERIYGKNEERKFQESGEYKASWLTGLDPVLGKYARGLVAKAEYRGATLTFEQLVACVHEKEHLLREDEVEGPAYLKRYQGLAQHKATSQIHDKEIPASGARICTYFNTSRGCLKGDECNWEHQGVVKATKGTYEMPAKGTATRDSICIVCKGEDPNYNGHFWPEGTKKKCSVCGVLGHMNHWCPNRFCKLCGKKGHTAYVCNTKGNEQRPQ